MADASEGVRATEVAPPDTTVTTAGLGSRQWPYWAAVAVAVVGLLVTGVLTWVSAHNYSQNEKRLLTLRAHDVGGALTVALPAIQPDLASAVALADATGGNVAKFTTLIAPYVG